LVSTWYHFGTKIRELIRELEKAGFRNRGGKGSHRNYRHPKGVIVVLSGKVGRDARDYQVKDVKQAIARVSNEKK
jgi:predicted RNA binding protein YcfA (HicA-like mRNA interferase family)